MGTRLTGPEVAPALRDMGGIRDGDSNEAGGIGRGYEHLLDIDAAHGQV
jgi:hypothetical protein